MSSPMANVPGNRDEEQQASTRSDEGGTPLARRCADCGTPLDASRRLYCVCVGCGAVRQEQMRQLRLILVDMMKNGW